jgi:hypothetical protein
VKILLPRRRKNKMPREKRQKETPPETEILSEKTESTSFSEALKRAKKR